MKSLSVSRQLFNLHSADDQRLGRSGHELPCQPTHGIDAQISTVDEDPFEEQEELVITAAIGAIPWLLSAVSHLALLIVLALAFATHTPEDRIVQVEFGHAEELDDTLEVHSFLLVEPPDVVEVAAIDPMAFWEELFEAPDIDLDIDSLPKAGEIDGIGVREVRNGCDEESMLGAPGHDDATERGDGSDHDGAFAAEFAAYWARQSFQTMQSCSVDPIDGNVFVAEAKLGNSHTVLAVDRYGKGRIAYYCDMTTLKDLMRAFPGLVQYLGRRPNPKVLVFGYRYLCQPLNSLPGFEYVGGGLPRQYDWNPSALAKDYDVVIFGARDMASDRLQFQESWGATLRDFAELEGRGLLLVGEYHGGSGIRPGGAEFDALNSIANAAGARFNKVSLAWGKADWGK